MSMTTPEPTVRPVPRKLRFRGYPLNLNAQGGKAALPPRFCPSDKTLVRRFAPPHLRWGPEGGQRTLQAESPAKRRGFLKGVNLLLDVDDDAGAHGAAPPTKASLSREPF